MTVVLVAGTTATARTDGISAAGADPEAMRPTPTADALALSLSVTAPGSGDCDHPGLERFAAGDGKEGVGLGGPLPLARRRGIPLASVRDWAATVSDRLLGTPTPSTEGR